MVKRFTPRRRRWYYRLSRGFAKPVDFASPVSRSEAIQRILRLLGPISEPVEVFGSGG